MLLDGAQGLRGEYAWLPVDGAKPYTLEGL